MKSGGREGFRLGIDLLWRMELVLTLIRFSPLIVCKKKKAEEKKEIVTFNNSNTATCFTLVSCQAHFSTLNIGLTCSSETSVDPR
jgi:hypothetical protein